MAIHHSFWRLTKVADQGSRSATYVARPANRVSAGKFRDVSKGAIFEGIRVPRGINRTPYKDGTTVKK